MNKYRVVIGKSLFDRRPKKYMEITNPDESVSYHVFKSRKHSFSTKYGPYGTIKQKAFQYISYYVGKKEYEVNVNKHLKYLDLNIDSVTYNCDF